MPSRGMTTSHRRRTQEVPTRLPAATWVRRTTIRKSRLDLVCRPPITTGRLEADTRWFRQRPRCRWASKIGRLERNLSSDFFPQRIEQLGSDAISFVSDKLIAIRTERGSGTGGRDANNAQRQHILSQYNGGESVILLRAVGEQCDGFGRDRYARKYVPSFAAYRLRLGCIH